MKIASAPLLTKEEAKYVYSALVAANVLSCPHFQMAVNKKGDKAVLFSWQEPGDSANRDYDEVLIYTTQRAPAGVWLNLREDTEVEQHATQHAFAVAYGLED